MTLHLFVIISLANGALQNGELASLFCQRGLAFRSLLPVKPPISCGRQQDEATAAHHFGCKDFRAIATAVCVLQDHAMQLIRMQPREEHPASPNEQHPAKTCQSQCQ